MFNLRSLHRSESGQTALETAIILIAFVVVASVFAFAILSAGTASTERGEQAIYAGLEGVQSSLQLRGAVIAQEIAAGGSVQYVFLTMALANGGAPVDLTAAAASRRVVIDYRDADFYFQNLDWTVVAATGNNDGDALLEDGEQMQIRVELRAANAATATITEETVANNEFTLEVKPPTGGVLNITRRTPPVLEDIMELR